MKEGALSCLFRTLASKSGFRLFRNNVGTARYTSKEGKKYSVKYGLMEGSGDLIGWVPITIQQHHVGRKMAVFCSVEIKTEGTSTPKKRAKKQKAWHDTVKRMGGISLKGEDRKNTDFEELEYEISAYKI